MITRACRRSAAITAIVATSPGPREFAVAAKAREVDCDQRKHKRLAYSPAANQPSLTEWVRAGIAEAARTLAIDRSVGRTAPPGTHAKADHVVGSRNALPKRLRSSRACKMFINRPPHATSNPRNFRISELARHFPALAPRRVDISSLGPARPNAPNWGGSLWP
jgi:hypothetical protein